MTRWTWLLVAAVLVLSVAAWAFRGPGQLHYEQEQAGQFVRQTLGTQPRPGDKVAVSLDPGGRVLFTGELLRYEPRADGYGGTIDHGIVVRAGVERCVHPSLMTVVK